MAAEDFTMDLRFRTGTPEEMALAELENFNEISRHFHPSPGDLPELKGIDVYGESRPLNGVIGGDHIIYVDFKKRYDLEARIREAEEAERYQVARKLASCRRKAGIVLADVSGHRITDALVSVMLHQAFLVGAIYEMDDSGEITTRVFENVNSRFYKSSSVRRFVTMIYGEIREEGTFRFISAGHPTPVVFSREYDRIVKVSPDQLVTFPPLGSMPSEHDIDMRKKESLIGHKERYTVNEINLMGNGDIMLLYTDGLAEADSGSREYVPGRLEDKLREVKDRSAQEIGQAILADRSAFHPPEDDLSLVVVKRLY